MGQSPPQNPILPQGPGKCRLTDLQRRAYVTPSPALVVKIVDRYGVNAAAERWGWLSLLRLRLYTAPARVT